MKKLLILAYDFPPYVSVSALRPYSWYRYLKEYGVYPIVVTRQWNNKYGNELDYIAPSQYKKTIIEETEFGTIIKMPYKPNLSNRLLLRYGKSKFKFLRKSITAYYEIMQFFFPVGTKSSIYYGAKAYLKNNKVNAIIATGEPFVLFKYANKLSLKNNIPWFADYRDPWSPKRNQNVIWQKFQAYCEKKYVSTAYKGITVSKFCQKKIEHVVSNKKIIILPNGYNPEIISETKNINQNHEVLSIAFIGSILEWNPYESFLRCLDTFVKNNNANLKLDFFGINKEPEIVDLLKSKFINLKSCVTIYPKTPNNELLLKLSSYNVLLLFNHFSIAGTKIYDYLAVKRFILFCYSKDLEAIRLKEKYYSQEENEGLSTHLQEDIINETKSGIIAKDYNHLYQILENLYTEFQEKRTIECSSINIEQYSRKYQVKKLAYVVDEI